MKRNSLNLNVFVFCPIVKASFYNFEDGKIFNCFFLNSYKIQKTKKKQRCSRNPCRLTKVQVLVGYFYNFPQLVSSLLQHYEMMSHINFCNRIRGNLHLAKMHI